MSGVSGVGAVAEGVEFSTGRVALQWLTGPNRSIALHDSLLSLRHVHGHAGRTEVVWVDQESEGA